MNEISEAAHRKAVDLGVAEADISPDKPWAVTAFARYIQQVSDAAKSVCRTLDLAMPTKLAADEEKKALAPFILLDPVDPLLIEARELAATDAWNSITNGLPEAFRSGRHDDQTCFQIAIRALKRGMELAGGKS